MVVCLEQGADLHMAQLLPLPLTVSCSSKIQIGFTFLVLAHLGSPGKRAVKWVCVCVYAMPLHVYPTRYACLQPVWRQCVQCAISNYNVNKHVFCLSVTYCCSVRACTHTHSGGMALISLADRCITSQDVFRWQLLALWLSSCVLHQLQWVSEKFQHTSGQKLDKDKITWYLTNHEKAIELIKTGITNNTVDEENGFVW